MLTFRSIAAACLVMGLLPVQASRAQDAPDKVAFYFAAHQDDWQLFMNPSAFKDVANSKTKAVFIHMTAGDAGLGTGTDGRKHPLYLARENGAAFAIQFMATADYAKPVEKKISRMEFNGHAIDRVTYGNAVAYFLRVPDGNGTGSGFPKTGFQSLKRLAGGEVGILAAIDGSTAYYGWTDLVATLRAIIDFERGRAPGVQINVADPDPAINPNDHSDHIFTTKVALDAAKGLTCACRAYYVDYASAKLPENLSPQDRDMESSVFAVTLAGIQALDHGIAWHRYDRNFVGKNYFRIEDGNGRCDEGTPQIAHARYAFADPQLRVDK